MKLRHTVRRKIQALVVDDNNVNKKILSDLLKKIDVECSLASNGKEACEIVKQNYKTAEEFDIIFMDIQMPIMDGIQATKHILHFYKHDVKSPPPPVVAVTAYSISKEKQKAFLAGVSQFLTKPISAALIHNTIATYFN